MAPSFILTCFFYSYTTLSRAQFLLSYSLLGAWSIDPCATQFSSDLEYYYGVPPDRYPDLLVRFREALVKVRKAPVVSFPVVAPSLLAVIRF